MSHRIKNAMAASHNTCAILYFSSYDNQQGMKVFVLMSPMLSRLGLLEKEGHRLLSQAGLDNANSRDESNLCGSKWYQRMPVLSMHLDPAFELQLALPLISAFIAIIKQKRHIDIFIPSPLVPPPLRFSSCTLV